MFHHKVKYPRFQSEKNESQQNLKQVVKDPESGGAFIGERRSGVRWN